MGEKVCRCPEGAYVGARMVGTPNLCERCRGLIDEWAQEFLDNLHEEARERLEAWAKENPLVLEGLEFSCNKTFTMCSYPMECVNEKRCLWG